MTVLLLKAAAVLKPPVSCLIWVYMGIIRYIQERAAKKEGPRHSPDPIAFLYRCL